MITDVAYVVYKETYERFIPLIKKLCYIKVADVIRLNIAKQNNI